jgi:hypothetical protein
MSRPELSGVSQTVKMTSFTFDYETISLVLP